MRLLLLPSLPATRCRVAAALAAHVMLLVTGGYRLLHIACGGRDHVLSVADSGRGGEAACLAAVRPSLPKMYFYNILTRYGWFSAPMLCGSCVGAVTWAARMMNIVSTYNGADVSSRAVQQRERRGCSVGCSWPLLARCFPSDVRDRVPVPDHGQAHGAAAHVGLRGAAGPLIRLILLPIRVITLVLRRGTARGGGGLQAGVSS